MAGCVAVIHSSKGASCLLASNSYFFYVRCKKLPFDLDACQILAKTFQQRKFVLA